MRKLTYLLATTLVFYLVCCCKEERMSEGTVQMTFCAEIPQGMGTRATGTEGLVVDQVVCAVFENDAEITNLRKVITIEEGKDIVFSPNLIKGRTYNVVFWASKAGCYNVTDLKAITRANVDASATTTETDYDAFTATNEIENVTEAKSVSVTLERPLAQLNIGTSEADWNAVAGEQTFNMTPSTMKVQLSSAYDTFNALTGTVVGDAKEVSYNLTVTGEDLTVNNTTYKNMATCYVLTDSEKETMTVSYSVYDKANTAIRENVEITNVPLQRNYQTNIIGGLLTSTITYTVTFGKTEFNTSEEFNKTIE